MLTGYWSIDAFIIANVLLWLLVAAVYFHYETTDGGMLEDSAKYHAPKE
ncbi:hypothetical protein MACH09_40330 [Vibrio sp. MACH09]|nr:MULTISPECIES: hypothetical protein [unclassified Vibrio]GLO63525.1 hypothetical protein MACH09_40330 [Vibrio sp. MACH09]